MIYIFLMFKAVCAVWSAPRFRTREDALDAWKIVQERNLKWEEQDREWKHQHIRRPLA